MLRRWLGVRLFPGPGRGTLEKSAFPALHLMEFTGLEKGSASVHVKR